MASRPKASARRAPTEDTDNESIRRDSGIPGTRREEFAFEIVPLGWEGPMKERFRPDTGSWMVADPFRCRVWNLSDRIEDYVTADSCRAEIASFERNGQLVPVVGRLLQGDPDFDIEIVCGTRRLFVARHLGIPIRVEVRELTDRQAAVAIEAENSLRKQTSPYERGLWLAKLLRNGIYRSRDEMARDLGITPTQVSRLLKFAELPAIIIGAFPSPHDILESWGVELHKAWRDERRRLLTERCRSLGTTTPRPAAATVYQTLVAARRLGRRPRTPATRRVVKSPDGLTLLRFERQLTEIVLRIPNALVNPTIEAELTEMVAAVLTRRAATTAESRAGPAYSAPDVYQNTRQ
jgi:ParB/RepB/Spo0J family partition protein